MLAGFSDVDITPPLGTLKIGWIKQIVSDQVLDPIRARIVVLESSGVQIGIIQIDTLSLGWNEVNDLRRRISLQHGFPGQAIMVTATHNHAGPAVCNCGDVPKDEAYTEWMKEEVVAGFGRALAAREEALVGSGSAYEWGISFNRRVVMRDGTTKTHGSFANADALYVEGPIDPEVGVIAVRSARTGDLLGAIVNFTCHPTHHGGTTEISAGYPGVLANRCRELGCPVTLFLNGACGNIGFSDTTGRCASPSKEEMGDALAEDVEGVLAAVDFNPDLILSSAVRTLELPFRQVTEDEVRGTVRGAQRFIDSALYDSGMPTLLEKIRKRGKQLAEVQALRIGDWTLVSIPAEFFVELGLQIKEATWPLHTLVSSCSNGMVGYVPTKDAFKRGGYETTFGFGYKLAPEAGDMLVSAAIELVQSA